MNRDYNGFRKILEVALAPPRPLFDRTRRMTEAEVIAEFTKTTRRPDGIRIVVAFIDWPSPAEPRTRWHVVTRLPTETPERNITAARNALLKNRRYFRLCNTCGETNPIGWMHDDHICQSCAEKDLGVVY
jgi:hypothetical protein